MCKESPWENMHENGMLEAKLAEGGLPHSLWQSYSSFANTNGGTIVLGVMEDKQRRLSIRGVSNAPDLVSQFWNTVNDGNAVNVNILVDENVHIETIDGADVVIIDVPRAARTLRPVFTGKNPITGTWRRRGEGDYRCSADEVQAMIRDRSTESVDRTVVEEMGLEVLDKKSVDIYRNLLSAHRTGHPWLGLPDDEFLWRIGAADRIPGQTDLHPTRAGLLMFGYEQFITREFGDYSLDFRRVDAAEGRRWSDRVSSSDGMWSGNILGFWIRVFPKLVDGLPMPFALQDATMRVDDTPMRAAVREALTNALCHADYLGRGGIVVIRHGNDSIELRNPGCLRLSRDLVERGGISDARNPTIMKMFTLLGIGEKAGSGFDTMRQGTRSLGLPDPDLVEELNPDRTTLVLPIAIASRQGTDTRATTGDAPRGTTEQGYDDNALSIRERQVLAAFHDGESLSTPEVARRVELSEPRTRALLRTLVDEGRLSRHGNARSTTYSITGSNAGGEPGKA